MLRQLAVASAFVLATLALAACGGVSPSTSQSVRANKFLAFAQCMRASGVPSFPDPGGGNGSGLRIQAFRGVGSTPQTLTVNGTPVSAPAFRSAMQKCRDKLPHGGRPTAQQIARIRAGALAMARCMRAHGVPNFPDPQLRTSPGGGIGVRMGGPGSGLDPSSPAFQNAAKVCMRGGFLKFGAARAAAPGG